jgi:hypothetical protein
VTVFLRVNVGGLSRAMISILIDKTRGRDGAQRERASPSPPENAGDCFESELLLSGY